MGRCSVIKDSKLFGLCKLQEGIFGSSSDVVCCGVEC